MLYSTNESTYTLATVHDNDEYSSLLSPARISYGSAPVHRPHQTRRVIFNATLKMALIFFLSCFLLGGTLWISLPTLDLYVVNTLSLTLLLISSPAFREDRPLLRIPKSFSQLQDLNHLLKKYRDIYPFRILISYVLTYLL
jgi:hypothetical protein